VYRSNCGLYGPGSKAVDSDDLPDVLTPGHLVSLSWDNGTLSESDGGNSPSTPQKRRRFSDGTSGFLLPSPKKPPPSRALSSIMDNKVRDMLLSASPINLTGVQ
jgi:hypothetical protein